MTVNSYLGSALNSAINSYSGKDILSIPGLLPVDLHSPNPYPVSFAPVIRPQVGSTPSPQPTASYPDASQLSGSASPPLYNPANAGGGTFGDASPGFPGASDAQFALNGIGTYGAGGGSPDYSGYSSGSYSSGINPAQLGSGLGSFNWDNVGSSLSDRLDSFTNSPDISGGNVGQAAINAGGLFSPLIPIGAGILQGFNLYDAPDTTGNPLTDLLGTPGMLQSGTADVSNWINRMFGGSYMPSSYIDPNMSGPPTPDGSPYNGGSGAYIPAQVQGPTPDGTPYSTIAPPDPTSGSGPLGGDGGGDPGWGTPAVSPADYYGLGGQAYNIGGADLFNSIGLSPWQTPDFGGAFGGGSIGGGGSQFYEQVGGNGFWGS